MNNTIKTSAQLAKEFAASQNQPRLFDRNKVRTVAPVHVPVAVPSSKKRFKDVLAVALTASTVAGLAIFGLQEALPALAGSTDVLICYGCGDGYSTAYDAIKALNPDASSKQLTALLRDFESLNNVLDAENIQQGNYQIPVMK